MATLVDVPTLALFTRTTIVGDDPLALLVLELASGLVCDTAQHPEWEDAPLDAPRGARRICMQIAGRTWTNPDLEVATGIGPLSSRVIDFAAYGLNLTDAEREELEGLRGGPDGGGGGLWLQPIGSGLRVLRTTYILDEFGQLIPYLDPNESVALTPVVP